MTADSIRTSLLAVALASTAFVAVTEARADEALDRLNARIRDCITKHASEVERSTDRLTDATDFLLRDLCAVGLRTMERYQTNTSMLAMMKDRSSDAGAGYVVRMLDSDAKAEDKGSKPGEKTLKKAAAEMRAKWDAMSVDPNTGEFVGAPMPLDEFDIASEPPASLVAFAAQAVLDVRRARLMAH